MLSPEQRADLQGLASSRSLPHWLVTRARIVLSSAAGESNQRIAREVHLCAATVGMWRTQTRPGGMTSSPRPPVARKELGLME